MNSKIYAFVQIGRTVSTFAFLWLLLLLSTSTEIFAQLSVVADRSDATYSVGRQMSFLVTGASSGPVEYQIRYDIRGPVIASGTVNGIQGGTVAIPFTASEPGFVLCDVNQFGQASRAGAGFDMYDIQPAVPEPADFDQFWNGLKGQLAAVPVDPRLEFYQRHANSTTYRISLGGIENRRVYGFITIPDGSGPFPAVLTVPAFGNGPGVAAPEYFMSELSTVIAMTISIHNVPADQVDPNGYRPDNIDNREEYYYKYGVMAGLRAIDYLFTRSDFDGQNLAVTGVSQGGGLSLMVSGLDNRVKLMVEGNAAMCEHSAPLQDRAGGFPFYLWRSRNEVGTPQHEQAVADAARYYDAIYFAKRYKGPSYHIITYEDDVCPPATTMAAVNQQYGNKVIFHVRELGHVHPNEYWSGRFDYFRREFPSARMTAYGQPLTNTGYEADAGPETLSVNNGSTTLNGSFVKNGTELNGVSVRWEVVSGPGAVNFSSPNAKNTSASFTADGTYILRFIAEDKAELASLGQYYSAMDHVEVNVSNSGGPSDQIPPTITLSTGSVLVDGPFQVSAFLSEEVNGFDASDVSLTNASVSNFSLNGTFASFSVNPVNDGDVTVRVAGSRFTDLAGNNNEASNVLSITYKAPGGGGGGTGGKADLNLVLAASPDTYTQYESNILTLELVNEGDVAAEGIIVGLPIPQGYVFSRANTTVGAYAGWTGEWEIESLEPGTSGTLELEIYALNPVGDILINAEVKASDTEDVDSTPGNANLGNNEDDEASLTLKQAGGGGSGPSDTTPPSVSLSTPNAVVQGPFQITVTGSEDLTGLTIGDFVVTNGSSTNLSGSGKDFTLDITPSAPGEVRVNLPAGAAADAAGNASLASNSISVVYEEPIVVQPGQYCDARGLAPWEQWINRIELNNIIKWSGKDQYGDYLNSIISIGTEEVNTILLRPGYSYAEYNEFWTVWVDLNQDGDFYDAGEQVAKVNGVGEQQVQFALPADTKLGTTRMRIIMQNDSYIEDPCATFTLGEVEDYTLDVYSGNPGGGGSGGGNTSFCTNQGDASNHWIKTLVFEKFRNNSENEGYAEYTNETIKVALGQQYGFELKPGFTGGPVEVYWRIWIDFNQDELFDPVQELVYTNSGRRSSYGAVIIPGDAPLGKARMRIVMSTAGFAEDACSNPGSGEVEDYILELSNDLANNRTNNISSRAFELGEEVIYPNPSAGETYIELPASEHMANIFISDGQGRILKRMKMEANGLKQILNTEGLGSGHYRVTMNLKGYPIQTQTLIILRD